jgi:primosomal protein N'
MNDPFSAYTVGLGTGADSPAPRVIAIQGPPGAGKTGKMRELITPYLQAGKNVVVAVPRHKLGDEQVEAFAAVGIDAARIKGKLQFRLKPDATALLSRP